MKPCFFILLSLITFNASAQFNRFLFMSATAQANVGQKALAYDNAGYGLSINTSFPGYSKWEVTASVSANGFFGDKIYYLPNEGRQNKGPAIYTLFAGPQYFILSRLAVSVTAGPAWYSIHTKGFSASTGYHFEATGYLGKKRRIVTRLSFSDIPANEINIQYFGLGIGYRFL